MSSTKRDKTIEEADNSDSEFDNISVVDVKSTEYVKVKSTKSKNLVKLKESGIGFFTFGARLVFIKLRLIFIKAPILYHFDIKYHN